MTDLEVLQDKFDELKELAGDLLGLVKTVDGGKWKLNQHREWRREARLAIANYDKINAVTGVGDGDGR